MKNFFKQFEDAMVSATFAEAGEFDTARQIIGRNKNANKKVLLGTDAIEINPAVVRKALNLCQRVGAKLEILQILKGKGSGISDNLASFDSSQKPAKEIELTRVFSEGSFDEEIVRCTENRRDIVFLVLSSAVSMFDNSRKRQEQYLASLIEKLEYPVVVFSELTEA